MKKHTVHAILTIFVVPILMFGYAAVSPGNTFSAHAATAKKVVAKTKKKAVKIAPATKKSKKTPIVKKQAAHKDSKISETPTKKTVAVAATAQSIDAGSYSFTIPNGWKEVQRPTADGSKEIMNTTAHQDFVVQTMSLPTGAPEKNATITDIMPIDTMGNLIKIKYSDARIKTNIMGTIGGQKAIVSTYDASEQVNKSDGSKVSVPFSAVQYSTVFNGIFYVITIRSEQGHMNIDTMQKILDSFSFK